MLNFGRLYSVTEIVCEPPGVEIVKIPFKTSWGKENFPEKEPNWFVLTSCLATTCWFASSKVTV